MDTLSGDGVLQVPVQKTELGDVLAEDDGSDTMYDEIVNAPGCELP